MSIADNLSRIKAELDKNTCLVAISKTRTDAETMEAYLCGQRIFGESRVQELVQKYERLPKDIEWHLIGHLQTNKVKYIVPFVSLIHSVDSLKLLEAIHREGKKNKRKIRCLLQFHIADEDTKFGFSRNEAVEMLSSADFGALNFVDVCGVMGMATFTDNEEQIRGEFKSLKNTFDLLKQDFFKDKDSFREISMGMSDDYRLAMEEGSTMVRIGSLIFGERPQKSF